MKYKLLSIISILSVTLTSLANANPNAIRAIEAAAKARALKAQTMQRVAQAQEAARNATMIRNQNNLNRTVQNNKNRADYARIKNTTQKPPVAAPVANDVNRVRANGTLTNYSAQTMQLRRNYHQGKLRELIHERNIYAKGNLAVPQATLSSGGKTARADFIEYKPKKNNYVLTEVKTGNATLSKNQSTVYSSARTSGASMSFRGSHGTHLVPATNVNTVRY
jgi:hypothetical protein